MAKFIELHDEKNRAVLVNIDAISTIAEIYESNAQTAVRMCDGFQFKVIEREKSVIEMLKNIR